MLISSAIGSGTQLSEVLDHEESDTDVRQRGQQVTEVGDHRLPGWSLRVARRSSRLPPVRGSPASGLESETTRAVILV